MKKLMMAVAAVAVAGVAQAASINWSMTNVYSSSDSTVKGAGYSAYLFLTENSSNVTGLKTTTSKAVLAMIGATDWLTGVVDLSSAKANLTAAGALFNASTGISSGFSSGSVSAFAIIFDSSDISTATHYYVVNGGETKSVSFTSATGAKAFAFGSQAANSAVADNWVKIIPEPTGAMLLLLGVAGLALRRKQK